MKEGTPLDSTGIKKMLREYYETCFVNMLENTDKMTNSLKNTTFQNRHDETEDLYADYRTEFLIKLFLQTKLQA